MITSFSFKERGILKLMFPPREKEKEKGKRKVALTEKSKTKNLKTQLCPTIPDLYQECGVLRILMYLYN